MLTATGICLAILTLYDALYTTLSHRGAGPITGFWTRLFWLAMLRIRYRFGAARALGMMGPLMLVGVIVVWNLLFYLSYFLVFVDQVKPIESDSDASISILDTLYYIGSTFSTLGMGDYRPTGFPWTLLTTMGATVVALLTTLSISYLVPVLSAAAQRRVLISEIDALGESSAEIYAGAWRGSDAGAANAHVASVANTLIKTAFDTHVYPVLAFFVFPSDNSSFNGAILRLYDALLLQEVFPGRDGHLPAIKLRICLESVEVYVRRVAKNQMATDSQLDVDNDDFLELIERFSTGHEGSTRELIERVAHRLECRRSLVFYEYFEGRGRAISPRAESTPNHSVKNKMQ